jgi:hypothetical protein
MSDTSQRKKCFVVSQIGAEGSDERKHADRVFKHLIEPACTTCSFAAERADHIPNAGSITTQVVSSIANSDLVIADLTNLNPNVMYELGLRHGTMKPVVQIAIKDTKLPFDVMGVNTLFYQLDLDHVENGKEKLTQAIEEAMSGRTHPLALLLPRYESSQQGRGDPQIEVLAQVATRLQELSHRVEDLSKENTGYAAEIYRAVKGLEETKSTEMIMQFMSNFMSQGMQKPKLFKEFMEAVQNIRPQADQKASDSGQPTG